MPNGKGMTNKEMIQMILNKLDKIENYNEKQNDKFLDFVERHHSEHNSLWDSIRAMKGGFLVSFMTVVAGIIFIILRII